MLAAAGGRPVALAFPRQAGSHSCPVRCSLRPHCPRSHSSGSFAIRPIDGGRNLSPEKRTDATTSPSGGAPAGTYNQTPLTKSRVPHSVCTADGNAPRERRACARDRGGPRGLGRSFVCGRRGRRHPGTPPVPDPAPTEPVHSPLSGAEWGGGPAFSRGKRVRGVAQTSLRAAVFILRMFQKSLMPQFESSEGKRSPTPNPNPMGRLLPRVRSGCGAGGTVSGGWGAVSAGRRAPPWPPPAVHQCMARGEACHLWSPLCLAFLLTDTYSSSFSGAGGRTSDAPRPVGQPSPATDKSPLPVSFSPPPTSLPFHLCCQEPQSSLRFSYPCYFAVRVAVTSTRLAFPVLFVPLFVSVFVF